MIESGSEVQWRDLTFLVRFLPHGVNYESYLEYGSDVVHDFIGVIYNRNTRW